MIIEDDLNLDEHDDIYDADNEDSINDQYEESWEENN